ncbi:hypothetical protein Tco_0637678 [Tanacetum coccineum]
MDTTKAQQKALDDALVAPENRLKIGKCNQRLSPTLKSNEPTIQVALDALKLTPFYNAFEVSADVPEIYMQECPKLPSQKFEDPSFEEEILSFIRDLGHTGEIKVLSDVNVNHLHQPWRSFAAIINKCLSGKTTTLESLRLSRAQILWGMYHNKNVDYVYLLWEDLVYQVENKNSKKNNDMYYPRFTKVIVDYFMAKDQAIPRRNKMFWHYARDDLMFTTIRVISKHQDTQVYGAILPQHLTNQDMLESKAYKTYRAYATGEKTPKPKSTKKKADSESSPKTKPTQASKGKRIKTSAKGVIPAKKKQSATKSKGLTVLSEVALTEAEQMKIALERSKIQTHSSHASGSGADEGTGITPGVPDVPTYESDAEQISWKSSDEEDDDKAGMHDDNDANEQDDVNELTDSDNDGDDFVHPKLSTHDEEDKEEEDSDPRVHTPSNYESTDDEESDEEIQGANVEGEEMDVEETNEEDKANELYRDVNVNLEGRDTEMTDAPRTIVQTTQVIEDTHVIITPVNPEAQQQSSSVSSGFVSNMLNPSPDTGIDSIFNLNTESTSLIDVPVTTIVEPPLLSTTTLPPPPTPLITHLQQTPIPTPATAPSSSLQDLPNFGSLFGFDHRLKTLETDFSELKQTNQFAAAVSSIPGIVDAYLANKMHEAVKTAVQLQSDRLRDEAQAENADFINKLDDNIKKIIKDQVKEQVKAQVSKILPKIKKTVNEQLEAEVLTRSSNESKTSHAVAANLSELELKKILIDKMESNKSIHRSDEQKNLYKALVDAYESDKLILDTYGETVSFKRRRDEEDKDEEPSAGSNRGSKRRRAGKEPESTSAPKEKTSKTTGKSTEGSKSHQKSADESAQAEEPMQTAKDLEEPAHQEFETGVTEDQPDEETSQLPDWFQKPAKPPTPDRDWNKTLPDAHGPVQPWLSSLAQMEDPRESFNELMDTPLDFSAFVMNRLKVDTLTPELLAGPTFELMKGSCKSLQYPHDLRKPLPLIPNSRGRQVIPFDHFINNDLAESTRDVYSKRRIIAVTKLQIVEWHNYKHLDWITVRKDDDKLYKFKEGDFNRLRIQDIEDMLLLLVLEALSSKGNKDKKNKLMRINELHKFSDGTLNDVRTALDDRLKGIRMKYLPQTIWRQSDRDKAGAMILMRTASAAAKPCQGDSSEFYLITCSIYTDQQGTMVLPTIGAADSRRSLGYLLHELSIGDNPISGQSSSRHSTIEVDRTNHQSLVADNGSSPLAYLVPGSRCTSGMIHPSS